MGVINKAALDVQVQAHATLARAYTHLSRRTATRTPRPNTRRFARSGRTRKTRSRGSRRPTRARTTGDEAAPRRQGGHRRRRGLLLRGRRDEARGGRFDQVPRVPRSGDEGRRPQAREHEGHGLVPEEEADHRKGVGRVQEDRRSPARRPPALGHRGRFARRPHVGRVRGRVPRRPDSGGLEEGRRASRRLLRRSRRRERADQGRLAQREAGARDLPRRTP